VPHVITTEQIAIIVAVFVVAFASTVSRAIRDGDRRSSLRVFGLGSTAGFLGMGLYCVGAGSVANLLGAYGNLFWIGIAALLGFSAPYQDKLGGDLLGVITNKLIGGLITFLSAFKKDDTKE
jgi:hypothetical protein